MRCAGLSARVYESMVRKLLIVFAEDVLLGTVQPAITGQSEDAQAAFSRGDYASARRLWRLLAG